MGSQSPRSVRGRAFVLLTLGWAAWVVPAKAAAATDLAGPQVAEPAPVPAGLPPRPGRYHDDVDVLHYDFDLDLTGPALRGRAAIRVARVPPFRDTLVLDLSGLGVDRVTVAAGSPHRPAPVPFVQRDGTLRIPVPPGDTLDIVVAYGGVTDDGLVPGSARDASGAFADNWPNRARFWIPTVDHPSDKATVAWTVRVPEGWEVVAGGRRVGARGEDLPEDAPPEDGVWRWRMDVPIPTYTMVIGAADFAVTELDGCAPGGTTRLRPDGCVAVSVWSATGDSAAAARTFARAADILEFYAGLIAPYPYEKLAHVQSSTRFGGMENAGAIFYARGVMRRGEVDGLIAHETAHQWFGDAVTPADWRHLWLSEGFASYLGPLYLEHVEGPAAFRRRMADMRDGVAESAVLDRPVVDPSYPPSLFDLLNANSYDKGAWVLHMLRAEVGDDAFFDGIRRYYRAHLHGTALTADLRRAMEEASGQELAWFFDQWIHAPGLPVLRIEHEWSPGASAALVKVEQTQPGSWPTFRFPLTLEIRTEGGTVRRTVRIAERQVELRFLLDGPPREVRVDPDVRLLHQRIGH